MRLSASREGVSGQVSHAGLRAIAEGIDSYTVLRHLKMEMGAGGVSGGAGDADDIALTQCILCLLLVLCVFGLHWLKPEWQIMLLEQYAAKRDAPPVLWLDQLLRAVQQWITK